MVNTNGWPRCNDHGSVAARTITRWLLGVVEFLFLLAYGWRRTPAPADSEEAWEAPAEHPKAPALYGRTHAVNSTRYYLAGKPPKGRQATKACECQEGTPGVRCATTGVWVSVACPLHGRH